MAKYTKNVVEYRVYDLPLEIPIVLLTGEQWRISDERSNRLHFHNCIEIGYCHSDSGTLLFEDESIPFRTGDITVIPRHIPHSTCSTRGTRSLWSYLFLDLNALLSNFLPVAAANIDSTPQTYVFNRAQHSRIHFLANGILEEMKHKPTDWEPVVKGLALALYYEMLRMQQAQAKPKAKHGKSSFVLKPVLEYIHKNYMHQISMRELADICHLSETHFRRLFLSIMGTSPLSFINATRINQACVLLDTTSMPVLEIAESVGINSISSFNRNFHQIMNISPRDYRNAVSKVNISPKQKYVLAYKGWQTAEERPEHVCEAPPPGKQKTEKAQA